jgi:hypothetical protein
VRCQRVNLSGCQVLDGQPYGVYVEDSDLVSITGSSILETRAEKKTRAALCLRGKGKGNLVAVNTLARGTDDVVIRERRFEAQLTDNLVVE